MDIAACVSAYIANHFEKPSIEVFLRSQERGQHFRSNFAADAVSLLRQRVQKSIEQGQRFTFPGAPDYPNRLLHLTEPPLFLAYIGEPLWLQQNFLAVVGSRNPSDASLDWIEKHLTEVFRQTSTWCSLSGGAFGVDQAAHQASLRCHKPTMVVLPSGLDCMYPKQLNQLREAVVATGGVFLTEYGPNLAMRKFHFTRRNQLIAALSKVVLIVDAKVRSGTMLTAKYAADLGRPLLVLPAHPEDEGARGSLSLLCDGANPVRDAQDVRMYIASEE